MGSGAQPVSAGGVASPLPLPLRRCQQFQARFGRGQERIVTRRTNAESMRAALVRPGRLLGLGAALLCLALTAFWPATAMGQRGGRGGGQPRSAGRSSAPRNQYRGSRTDAGRQDATRPYAGQNREFQNRGFENRGFEGQNPGYRQPAPMGGFGRGESYGRQPQNYGRGENAARPAYPGAAGMRPAMPLRPYGYPGAFPPGHLGSWLNQHRNIPVQGQEQLLRNDPSFRQLPPSDQQRLMRQLQQVDRMPEQQRERRLEREELIEHMSPQERMQLSQSSRQFRQLPADRQELVKRAFQDLRSVPLDQRQMVLDSQRYQGMFTPQERNILGNLLRAEPYEPAR